MKKMMLENFPALLLFIPFIVFYFYPHKNNDYYSPFSVKSGDFSARFSSALYTVSIVLIIIALSGPSMRKEKTRYLSPGENYFFVLDVSPSMSVSDIDNIRRIDAAKKMIKNFRGRRANDYPGLILFSDEAFLSVPPSPDTVWFDKALENADIIYPDKGTAIGDAAALAVFYLKKSVSENRIVVLISDGLSNTGAVSPEAAAEAASENNIKIYTVSAGSAGGRDNIYNEETLEMMASETGALHFKGETMKELEYALSFISSMEDRERTSEKIITPENYDYLFIIAALCTLLLSVFIKIFILKEICL